MKKSYLILAAAAIFAACSSDDGLTEQQAPQAAANDGAIVFAAYINRGVTRAGATGELVTAPLSGKADLQTQGFGVFGYYTNNELYSESSKPNFFYNQKVSGAGWTYSPIKYWPNEYGSAAISDAQDKLTFFAYAPWVDIEPTTGLLRNQSLNNTGIVALTRNTASGDPFVKYFVDMEPAKRVDLCWGVAKEDFTSSVEGDLNNIEKGKTYKDVSKPAVDSKINFEFNHALASLNVQIDADIDQDYHGDKELAAGTKIFVRSVTFEGFASKGMFNLNAEKTAPKWYDLTGINELTNGKVTIYDGRRDGSEGQVNADASNETPKDLNPVIIQSYSASALSGTAGVPSSGDPVNLFNSATAEEPVYVIPTGEPLKVTIVYDVETEDANLAAYLSDGKTKGSSVENTITKPITITTSGEDLKLVAGKKYTVKLHLGMTSVKFDATVGDWVDGDTGEPWLPINNNAITAAANASATEYAYTFAGGTGTHTLVSSTPSGVTVKSGSTGTSGTLQFAANNSVKNINYVVVVKDETTPTAQQQTINITEAAHELELSVNGETLTGDTYELTADDADFVLETTATYDWSDPVATIVVEDANAPGVALVSGTAYTWDAATQTITITGAMPTTGNDKTFVIKVKAGDVEDSIKVKVTKS